MEYPTDVFFNTINLKEVQDFYKDRFIDGGSFDFVIVGDFEYEKIEPLIEKYIGSLPNLKRKDPPIDHGIRYTRNREYNEYREDNAKKAEIFRVYFKDYKYSLRDKTKAYLLFSVLDKLLFDNVREKDNLVYSISASLKTNNYWLTAIVNAEKYNQNIEQVTYLNNIVDSITLNETSKLAIKLFDDKYFEDVSYIAE
jgi:zinc protease